MQKSLCLILLILFSTDKTLACLSITDDFNFPNPSINANFTILPDISPFTDCWEGTIRIRSNRSSFRLTANRSGPTSTSMTGNPQDDVTASDLTLLFQFKNFGMAQPDGAILVSPFSSETDLSSIQSGTFILSGLKKSGNSCSNFDPNFYKLTKRLCLFRDFVFNPGEYNGQVFYLLVAP